MSMTIGEDFVDSRKSSSESIFSYNSSRTTNTPSGTTQGSKNSPSSQTRPNPVAVAILNRNNTNMTSSEFGLELNPTDHIWNSHHNPDSLPSSSVYPGSTNLFELPFSEASEPPSYHPRTDSDFTGLIDHNHHNQVLSASDMDMYDHLMNLGGDSHFMHDFSLDSASTEEHRANEYEDTHRPSPSDTYPRPQRQRAYTTHRVQPVTERIIEPGKIIMCLAPDLEEEEIGQLRLNPGCYNKPRSNHKKVVGTVFAEWNRLNSSEVIERMQQQHDLVWKPLSIYTAYTNIKVAASLLAGIPHCSCFGKINMRCKRAWVRAPNKTKRRRYL